MGSELMTREKPILFSGEMVRAILSGQKTQTRRIVNFQRIAKQTGCTRGKLAWSDTFNSWAVFGGNGDADLCLVECPYGRVGERLWVRETFIETPAGIAYAADGTKHFGAGGELPKRPSIFLPRWACRIELEITGVRVERLQEISGADALAEGVGEPVGTPLRYGNVTEQWNRDRYCELWKKINGPGSWESNPYVWVISFERKEPT
jgi:hypothetical protein